MKPSHVIVAIVAVALIGALAFVLLSPKPEQPSQEVAQVDTPTPSSEATRPPEVTLTPTPTILQELPEQPAVAGYVIDMSGVAVPGVIVSASSVESPVRSDANGHFAFSTVEGGTSTLRVDQAPYLPISLKGLDLPTKDAVFVLCRGGQIRGTITNMLSRPEASVTVEAVRVAGPLRSHASMAKIAAASSPPEAPWRLVLDRLDEKSIASVCFLDPFTNRTTASGSDGRYVMDQLPPGTYTIRAKRESLIAQPREKVLLSWEETLDGIDLKLGSGYHIRGRAYEEKSGASVASVTVSHHVTGMEAVTQGDGTYDLGPVPPGLYNLRVQTPPSYIVTGLPIGREGPEANVTDQDISGVDVKLERAGSVSGWVVDGAGQPVRNARVSLALQSFNLTDIQRIGRIERVARGERTDEQGRFRLDRVPESKGYVLYAGAEGYASGRFGPFDLGYGETKENIEIVLTKGGTVLGRILDQNGDPVPEYAVVCLPGDNFFSVLLLLPNEQLRKTGKSGNDGSYRIESVPEGKNVVMLYRTLEMRGGMPKAQRTVDVTATTEASFTIDVAKLDGVITGHVTTSKGQPAPGILVMAMGKNMAMGGQEGFQSQSITDKEGAYTLQDLLKNTDYTVFASDAERAGGPGGIFSDSVSKTVRTSAENVDFVLPGRGGISGRVAYKLTGRPVPAFRLAAARIAGEDNPLGGLTALVQGMFGGGEGTEFSSRDGSFVLRDLAIGTYNLEVSGQGFAKTTRDGVIVQEDQTTTEIVIEVEGGGGVEGVVRDAATKRPIEGALVAVEPGGIGAMFSLLGFNMPQANKIKAITGPDGKFSITGLDEGAVTLRVSCEGYAPETLGPVLVPGERMQAVQVDLARGGRIEGHVYDGDSKPLPGAQLTIFAADGSTTLPVTTDSEGAYQKESVPEGHYIVGFSFMDVFSSQHDGNLQGRGEVRNGQTTVIDIGGPGGVTVVGTVLRGGQPVPGVTVVFAKGSEASIYFPGGMLSRVTADQDGNYRASGLPAGPAKLLVTRFGAILQGKPPEIIHRQEIQLPDSGEIRIDIDLQLSTLAGSVRDAETGQPIEGAMLILFPDLSGPDRRPYELRLGADGEMGVQQERTSGDGRYRFPEVDPRKYVLTCRAEGYGQQAVEVTAGLVPGPDIDFTLPKQVGEVTGRITYRATGRAVPSAVVYLIDQYGQMVMPAGSGQMGMIADQSGRFRIDSVAPGAYALMCGDPMGGLYAWSRTDGVVVLAGKPTELEIQVDRGASVVLSLVDPQGQPVLGAQWRLYDSRGTSLAGQMLALGNTMRTSLPPGEYTARAELPGFQPVEFPFVIGEGQPTFESPIVAQPM